MNPFLHIFTIKKDKSYLLYSLYFVFFIYLFFLPTESQAEDTSSTKLEIFVLKQPVTHDGDSGKSQIKLIEKTTNKVLFEETWDGLWHNLGYNPKTHSYILSGESGLGAWRPLREIRYLNEVSLKSQPSRYNEKMFYSFTSVAAPQAYYLALIGGLSSSSEPHLLVLNTNSDTLKELGPAPAPPALNEDNGESASIDATEKWQWGMDYRDTYVQMDPDILVFTKDSLIVSYGQDTAYKRSEKRQKKTFQLPK